MGLLLKSDIQNQSVKTEGKSGLVFFVHGELVRSFWVESMQDTWHFLNPCHRADSGRIDEEELSPRENGSQSGLKKSVFPLQTAVESTTSVVSLSCTLLINL